MLYVDEYSFLISAIEFFGAMMCLIAIVIDYAQKEKEGRRKGRLVRSILHCSMFSLTADAVSYLFDLNVFENAILINKIILFIDFISYLSAFYLMFIYIVKQLSPEKKKLKSTVSKIITGVIAIDYLMLFTNPFTEFVYLVDENNEYIKCVGMEWFTGILFVIAFSLILFIYIEKKHFVEVSYMPLVLCLSMLILGGVVELILDDFPGTNIGIGVGILFIYWVYKSNQIKNADDQKKARHRMMVIYLFLGMTFGIFITFIINVSAIISVTEENSIKTSETEANMINESVVNLFIRPITVAQTMAHSSNLKEAIIADANADVDSENKEFVDYLISIRDGNDYQMVFAVSDLSQKYYTYKGVAKVLDTENDNHDIWYKDFMEMDKDYDLNVDTDETNNWELSVFVNTKIRDINGEVLGSCGVGVLMDNLRSMISQFEEEYGVKIYLVDTEGLIQVASDMELIETKTLEKDYFGEVGSKSFYYERLEDTSRLTKYDEDLDWYIVIIDDNPDKVSVAKIVRPGLFAAIISIMLMLVAFVGINAYDERLSKVIAENKKTEDYLKKVSETDELTKLYNRRAYEMDRNSLGSGNYGEDFLVMIMDINGLKGVNDNIGHDAGDELIIGAADTIKRAFSVYGKIYRIGGDEFALNLNMAKKELDKALEEFKENSEKWSGEKVKELSLSFGYAYYKDNKDLDFEGLTRLADARMYEDKNAYYQRTGKDRRR